MSGKSETSSHQVARHSGEVRLTARIGNSAKVRSDDKTFDWTLFVESNDREIAGVRCELHHRTFRQPIVQMVPSDKTRMRWELKSAGWGSFDISIQITWVAESTQVSNHTWELIFFEGLARGEKSKQVTHEYMCLKEDFDNDMEAALDEDIARVASDMPPAPRSVAMPSSRPKVRRGQQPYFKGRAPAGTPPPPKKNSRDTPALRELMGGTDAQRRARGRREIAAMRACARDNEARGLHPMIGINMAYEPDNVPLHNLIQIADEQLAARLQAEGERCHAQLTLLNEKLLGLQGERLPDIDVTVRSDVGGAPFTISIPPSASLAELLCEASKMAGVELDSNQLHMGGEPLFLSDHSQAWYTIEQVGIADGATVTLREGNSGEVNGLKQVVDAMEHRLKTLEAEEPSKLKSKRKVCCVS